MLQIFISRAKYYFLIENNFKRNLPKKLSELVLLGEFPQSQIVVKALFYISDKTVSIMKHADNSYITNVFTSKRIELRFVLLLRYKFAHFFQIVITLSIFELGPSDFAW